VQRLIKMNDSPTIDAFVDPETTNELEKIVVIKVRVAGCGHCGVVMNNFVRMCNREELPKELMF